MFICLGEEARLVTHLKEMANIGYGYSRQEVVDVASNFAVYLNKRTRDNPMSLKWFYSFLAPIVQHSKSISPAILSRNVWKGTPYCCAALRIDMSVLAAKYALVKS
jgi:hypothetical protein